MSEVESESQNEFLPAYRVRLRFFTTAKIKAQQDVVELRTGDLVAELSGPVHGQDIDSSDIRINVRGLLHADAARDLARNLKSAVSIMAAFRTLGIDLGEDLPTTALGASFRKQLESQGGHNFRDDVHGVDVFYETRPTAYFAMNSNVSISIAASVLAAEIEQALLWVAQIPPELLRVANLLNATDYARGEAAKIALGMAAIEVLAPKVKWSTSQQQAIADLHRRSVTEAKTDPQLKAVAKAISDLKRGPSLGTALRKLLADFDLPELWEELEELRRIRGKLMHGDSVTKNQQIDAASRIRKLATQLFVASLRRAGLPERTSIPST